MVSKDGLEKEFAADVEKLLSLSPFEWYVTCGYRSEEESNRLHKIYLAGGPRAAPGGKSPHNFGEAIDVVHDRDATKPGCQMDWSTADAAWQWLFGAIKAHPRLHSGLSFNDSPHIESVKFAKSKGRNADGTYFMPKSLNLAYVDSRNTDEGSEV